MCVWSASRRAPTRRQRSRAARTPCSLPRAPRSSSPRLARAGRPRTRPGRARNSCSTSMAARTSADTRCGPRSRAAWRRARRCASSACSTARRLTARRRSPRRCSTRSARGTTRRESSASRRKTSSW
ncbi:hypothetical protein VHUM_02221 [Vanrija humicola]|uniref:Uncharacterized protein n=1 Tax=Vanrija humicola TaxID=5417 RepID=A0A7D8Z003_VANHU|nr:hypothetical protein VHUM_02221 [Vanrija humicola]